MALWLLLSVCLLVYLDLYLAFLWLKAMLTVVLSITKVKQNQSRCHETNISSPPTLGEFGDKVRVSTMKLGRNVKYNTYLYCYHVRH